MEITEEQRKRAEANRLAALAKRQAAAAMKEDVWKLFKCRKVLPESNTTKKPEKMLSDELPKSETSSPDRFSVRLEICSPDSFSVTPGALPGFHYPGDVECLQRLNECLSFVVPLRYTQNQSGGNGSVYKLTNYDMVLKCLKHSKGIECQEIPQLTLRVVQKLSESFTAERWIPCRPEHLPDDVVDGLIRSLPKMLFDSLLPFQLDGVRFGLRRGGRCLIADEMGLGKTLQAIAIACCFMNEGPILVVCPAILRFSWAEELERWLPSCLPTDIHLVFGHQNNPAHLTRCPRVVIISYTMLHHLRKSMLEQKWALLIVDESHNVRCTKKASEPGEIKAVLDVATKVKRIILLSGTPSLSRLYANGPLSNSGDHRPYDIFHQIDILWPGLLGRNKYEFANNYCAVKSFLGAQGKVFKDFSKGIRLEELNVLLKQSVMIRRLKEHVLVQLPPKRRQVIRLMLNRSDIILASTAGQTSDSRLMERQEQSGSALSDLTTENDADRERPLMISYDSDDDSGCNRSSRKLSNQEIGIAKLSGFREWLSIHPIASELGVGRNSEMDLSSRKMIIFAHHHVVLDGVQAFACEKGIQFVRIDGHTLAMDRQSAVQSFRSSPEVKIALIGISVGYSGLDLSVAQTVVFLELPRTANDLFQAEDRAHRRGQTNAVNVYIFCAKDTSDESHWQRLNRQIRYVSSVTNGKSDAVEGIVVENVSDLCLEGGLAQYKSLEANEAADLKESLDSNNISKTDNSIDKNGILENVIYDKLSQAETMDSKNTALNWGMQPCKSNGDVSEMIKDRSNKKIEDVAHSSMQEHLLHFGSGRVSDLEAMGDSCPSGSSEGVTFEEREIRCPGIVSTSKLDEGSHQYELLGNIEHGGVLFTNAEPPISQKGSGNLRMQADKMCTVIAERDPSVPNEPIEADISSSAQADCLRFEVSQYTGRVHLYSCIPGKDLRPKPLFENFRPEELDSLSISAADTDKEGPPKYIKENPAYRDVLLAFVKEWNSLRPIEQKKLFAKPLQLPLSLELCYLKESINHGNGGLLKGGSKRRATPLDDISHPLPENAVWKKISLCSGNGKKEKIYTQGWTLMDEPLCKLCQTPCKAKLAKTPEFFEDLFCNLGCYEEYRLRTSQKSLREALFQIEHGICTNCKVDCHKLVECIRPLSIARRQEYIEKVAPKVAGHKNLLDKLIHEPIEGNAWHADHIVPVYQGGGECRLENMRTLCVACHSEVTAAQRNERRLARIKAKEQLKVIMSGIKDGGNIEHIGSNLRGHGLEMQEGTVDDDELLIKVPGSAYSESASGNQVHEKSSNTE